MTIEKYVDEIVKRVKCSGKRKEEIKKQLLSDISAAIDSGETEAQVMERMGSVREMAEDFNQNLSPQEIRRYTGNRRKIIFVVIVLAIVVVLGLIWWMLPKSSDLETSNTFDAAVVEEQTRQVIDFLDKEDYTALQAISTEEMKPVLEESAFSGSKSQIGADWGAMQTIGNLYMVEVRQRGKRYAVVEVNVSYEWVNVTYRFSFDTQMRLAGLYMR